MRTKGPLVHLDDLCEEFEILLVDTSALIRPLDKEVKKSKLIDRINSERMESDSSIFFNKCLKEKGVFYITSEIFQECYKGKPLLIREVLSKYDGLKLSKKEKEYFSSVCSLKKERSHLLKSFKKEKKIISLNDLEERKYQEIFKKNLYLKKINRLSNVDYDLLITGAVLSMARENTAVLSNDFPLLYAYQSLIREGSFDREKYGFFIRIKQEHFSRAIDKFNS